MASDLQKKRISKDPMTVHCIQIPHIIFLYMASMAKTVGPPSPEALIPSMSINASVEYQAFYKNQLLQTNTILLRKYTTSLAFFSVSFVFFKIEILNLTGDQNSSQRFNNERCGLHLNFIPMCIFHFSVQYS